MWRSDRASTVVPVPTWPAWSCGWPSRSGCAGSPRSDSPRATRSPGRAARCGAHATCRWCSHEDPGRSRQVHRHARCYGLAPELFDVDDYGLSTVVGGGTVPVELENKARLAIANCPEYAIEELPD